MIPVWVPALNFTLASASVIASIWLFVAMLSLPLTRRTKLLARQLTHNALADFLAYAFYALGTMYHIVLMEFNLGGSDFLCNFQHLGTIGIQISAYVDVHIALAAVFAIFRCRSAARKLSRWLILMWPLGAIVGILGMSLSPHHWDDQLHACKMQRSLGAEIRDAIVLTAEIFGFVVYIVGTIKLVGTAGMAVVRRNLQRSMMFLLVNAIIQGPEVLRRFVGIKSHSVAADVSKSLFMLGGVADAVLYVLLNRKYWRNLKQQRLLNAAPRSGSFPVAFAQDEQVSVVNVPNDQGEARRTAEREIQSIESARVDQDLELDSSDILSVFDDEDESAVLSINVAPVDENGPSQHSSFNAIRQFFATWPGLVRGDSTSRQSGSTRSI